MLQEWRTIFNELQQDRRNLMIRLNGLTPTQLEYQPAPGAWSVLEVVEHLALSEAAFLQDGRKNLRRPARPVTPREQLGALVVLAIMKSPIRVKAPESAKHVLPRNETPFDVVRGQWSGTRDELERFLEEVPADRRTSALFRHPVSGGLTTIQALRFIRVHIHHHHRQIDRLMRDLPQSPSNASAA